MIFTRVLIGWLAGHWHSTHVHVLSIVGARPQFVKLAPIAAEFSRHNNIRHTIVHTGQHYDVMMSDSFFTELLIPTPDMNLEIGSGSHGKQTGAMLAAIEEVLDQFRPDWTLVYGDTNSTVAGALAAVKLHLHVAHLEAGLRSFNRIMPEEHNRILTDHAADLLLAPTEVAMEHLSAEGLAARSLLVGDVMTDLCLGIAARVTDRTPRLPSAIDPSLPYFIATIHRAENTDDPERLRSIVASLRDLPQPVVLTAHPRLQARAREQGVDLCGGSLVTTDPLSYTDMVTAVQHSIGVVTDSGGLQKEAYLLGVPCTTIRSETEWPETLADDWNVLIAEPHKLSPAAMRPRPSAERAWPYGHGHAAQSVRDALIQWGHD